MDRHGLDARALEKLLYHESGLPGLSGVSSDMRTLLASDDPSAKETIELFVYRIGRELGSLVSCPRNSRYIAGGQLAVFQGGPSRTGGKAPISESYGSSEQRGKTANWPRPRGLRSKWAGGRVARRLRIDSDMLPLLPVR